MNTKSYVSVEQAMCPVCGTHHDTGVLLDCRLRNTLERTTVTHVALCPEHQKLYDDGYIALVEADSAKSGITPDMDRIKPEDAYRTGRVAHLKRRLYAEIFNVPLDDPNLPMVFVEPEVIDMLIAKQAQDAGSPT
jgi:hypothetical protein